MLSPWSCSAVWMGSSYMCACSFSKASISFAYLVCGISQDYLVLCACSDKSQIAEVRIPVAEVESGVVLWAADTFCMAGLPWRAVGVFGLLSEGRLQWSSFSVFCRHLTGVQVIAWLHALHLADFQAETTLELAFNSRAADVTWAAKVPRM